jgi:hypothetical protein
MAEAVHPAAPHHLPFFITAPGETDILFNAMVVFLVLMILMVGILYFRLHALPEHIAHRTHKVQLEFVAVLCLLALFTHNHLFWIAALLLALVRIPDFSTPLARIADAVATMAGRRLPAADIEAPALPTDPRKRPARTRRKAPPSPAPGQLQAESEVPSPSPAPEQLQSAEIEVPSPSRAPGQLQAVEIEVPSPSRAPDHLEQALAKKRA